MVYYLRTPGALESVGLGYAVRPDPFTGGSYAFDQSSALSSYDPVALFQQPVPSAAPAAAAAPVPDAPSGYVHLDEYGGDGGTD